MEQHPTTPDGTPVAPSIARPASGFRRARLVAGLTATLGVAALGGLVASQRFLPPAGSEAGVEAPAAPDQDSIVAEAAPDTAPAKSIAPEQRAETPAAEQGADAPEGWRNALLQAPPASETEPSSPAEPEAVQDETAQNETAPVETAPPAQARMVPLPLARPPEFGGTGPARRVVRQSPRRTRTVEAPAPVEDTRSFFDKLFGVERPAIPPAPALAYASLETPQSLPKAVPAPAPPVSLPPSSGGGTAIYDISARTVTLPNGEKLEAHSGLGSAMDDPRHVHLPMRGPTPPGTYDLTEREQVFHGVRAIRMTPVGGSGAIYGRVGILAHTYMLGPTGASNGCVAFRDYDKFLQSFLRGEIARLVVVAGNGNTGPSLVSRLFGANR